MRKSGLLAVVSVVIAFCILVTAAGSAQTFAKLRDCMGDCGPAVLILGSDGNLYASTDSIGSRGGFFKMTPSGAVTVLYRLSNSDGEYPEGSLAQGLDGNFYGTTSQGGGNDVGTVFRLTPGGNFTTLYTFCSFPHCWDGTRPRGLTLGADGNLYGSTDGGGQADDGTIFRIKPNGDLLTLYEFTDPDGRGPGHLIQDENGNFWGTARAGGEITGTRQT